MNKFRSAVYGVALGGAVGFGSGALLGLGYDALNVTPPPDGIQLEIDEYKSNLATQEELDADLDKYGSVCLRVLSYYEDGGPLADTSEDDMVKDVVQYPDQPCGNNDIDVRVVSRTVLPVRNNLLKLEEYDINAKYADLEKNAQKIEDDKAYNAWLDLAIGCSVLGALVGLVASLDNKDDKY